METKEISIPKRVYYFAFINDFKDGNKSKTDLKIKKYLKNIARSLIERYKNNWNKQPDKFIINKIN